MVKQFVEERLLRPWKGLRLMKTSTSKSQGEVIYFDLCAKLLLDLSYAYPEESSLFQRDIDTLRDRFHSEGVSFLTKTLPKLGKAIDRSLETGILVSPREFKRSHENRSIPAFMQAMTRHAYDSNGRLVGWDASRLKQTRQVLFLLYKLELPYERSQTDAVINAFLETESELEIQDLPVDERFLHVAMHLCHDVLSSFDWRNIEPRHGPGAVATGERGEEKWVFSRLYNQIHQTYPYYEYFSLGTGEILDRIKWYKGLTRMDTGRAKVVLVPKDSRGPRLISCEPLEYQWIQQGLGRKLMAHIESNHLTGGRINFELQTINRQLALSSSLTRKQATLDLKEASDRVSLRLVEWLFPPEVFRSLQASRTTSTLLPDGREVTLKKFAPMGSALCFPVEALVFWCICVAAVSTFTGKFYQHVAESVHVYGDDIIVDTEYVDVVVRALESCGLLVNMDKSFKDGEFRESCGMDAYKGIPVTPVKIHTLWSGRPSDGNAYASWVAYTNELSARGWPQASSYMWKLIETVYGKVPYGTSCSAFPCRVEDSWMKSLIKNIEEGFRLRYLGITQEIQVNAISLRPKTISTRLDSWPRLMRNLVSPNDEDPTLVTLPRSVQLKRGWRRL